jgi:hypothetical protein
VLRFLAGFLAASVLWGGFLLAYSRGLININLEPSAKEDAAEADDTGSEDPSTTGGKATGRKKKAAHGQRSARKDHKYTGEATTGDDLGGPEAHNLEAANAGGEEQLQGHEIEQGFDGVFPQVKRCLILAAGDEPLSGKIVFGLRISGHGGVTKVNLQGPSAITRSEAGDCLRKAAQGIHFRSFNGPDMLVHFPLTLQ